MKKILIAAFVNILTTMRIIGVFLLYPVYYSHGGVATAILAMLCYFTDLLDGVIARKAKVTTFFGSIYDTIADKLFSVANLVLLLTITRFAIIPILFEFVIVLIQIIKFNNNENIQSSLMGKIKTWIISFTIITVYLVTDINSLTFLSSGFIEFINSCNEIHLMGVIFIPLYVFDVLTLLSYLKYLKTYNPKEKPTAPKIDLYLKNPKNIKDVFINFSRLWLNHDFYEKYKDSAALRDIRRQVKANRED